MSEQTILGHPRGLVILFFTEMWERFSYYGMRGLLILYLTQHFLLGDQRATLLYGSYIALVYVMTIIGGSLADRYLGARKAVTFGAVLLVLGHFGMTFEGQGAREILSYQGSEYELRLDGRGGEATRQLVGEEGVSAVSFSPGGGTLEVAEPAVLGLPASIDTGDISTRVEQSELYLNVLYLSLGLIIAGVGFLKANISVMVGALYGRDDGRRESGFTIFYMGINLGAFTASILCGYLGIVHGWRYGFGLAGLGMLAGLFTFLRYRHWLMGMAEPPDPARLGHRVLGIVTVEQLCYLIGIGIVLVSMLLVRNAHLIDERYVGFLGLLVLAFMLGYAFLRCEGMERRRMLAALYFILAQIPFWALFEQAGSSLNLFTDRLVDRSLLGFTVPAPVFQSLNALFIILFAPLLAWLWVRLARQGRNPPVAVKFALGVFMAGLGFLVLVAGMRLSGPAGLTALWFVGLIYLIHTLGELMVSPVGLSAVTRLAPARAVGMTMGAWFLFSGLSNYLSGVIAATAGTATIGGQLTDVVAAKQTYVGVYTSVGLIAMAIAAVMLLIAPFIQAMMAEPVRIVAASGADNG